MYIRYYFIVILLVLMHCIMYNVPITFLNYKIVEKLTFICVLGLGV